MMKGKRTDPSITQMLDGIAESLRQKGNPLSQGNPKAVPAAMAQLRTMRDTKARETVPTPPSPTAKPIEKPEAVIPSTSENSAPKKTGRPRKYDPTITPAERARLSRQRRAEQLAEALTTGDLRNLDDKTLAAFLSRAIATAGQRQLVRHCLKELNRRFGVEAGS